jgi:DNA-directed RNA polymerase subunit RPC12/RpoP
VRLIDADVFKTYINGQANIDELPKEYIRLLIDEQPTIEAAPIVHGEWLINTGCLDSAPQYKCSNCGKPQILSHNWVTLLSKFCPECGTKMF